jgi:predicted Zn finger-like uncharacterized protein
MLIQCHSCNTKYRLNLEQIPRRKTFVRCKNCGTPIYIDPTEEDQPQAGVIPPQPAAAAVPDDGQVAVVCPSCSARYRIAEASVRRPGVKLKCTQCGHLFAPPAHLQAPRAAAGPAMAPPAPEPGPGPARPREMPLPDEAHMDQLFDDLRPGPAEPAGVEPPGGPAYAHETDLGTLEGGAFEEELPAPDAERAYLDSVAFDEEGGVVPGAASVPDEQKYRFFLNPKDYQGSEAGMADHPDDKGARPADEIFGAGEVPDLHGTAPGPELPHLPSTEVARSREEMSRIREIVPGQEARVFTEKRVLAIVAAAAVLILLATGAWGYWLASTAGDNRPFRVRVGQPHQLAMKDDLQGHYITNGPSGMRLFVVNGEITNGFPQNDRIRWIRIKGLVYTDPAQTKLLGTAYAYAGNVLDDTQLAQWELPAVKAYYGFTNGRNGINATIAPDAKVPYQLVFTELGGQQVGRSVAQVVSYFRDGQAVFVDNP